MGLNARLIKRTTDVETSDIIHSSGYAKVGNKNAFGSSSSTTFSERQQIEQQRKLIKGYRNARVASGVNRMPKANSYREEMAILSAVDAIEKANVSNDRREFYSKIERGGLKKYDTRMKSEMPNYIKRGSSAGINSAQSARIARAERFAAPARPTPKTGGFGR